MTERRVSGAHWWDPDRTAHLADRPRHCPNCGGAVTGAEGISVEYWEADRKVFHTWCNACGWAGDIVRIQRMVGHEPED
ncbi:MAG: hypothetical protein F4Y40_11935 [Acidimicrobiia bacterium]|nr:hypothetical protein [Acidimicrobiia bacterium]MYF84617.1 hypothetical protein [Acidimicrobiia bacterium]